MSTSESFPIPVTRSSLPPLEEYVAEIESLWESRWLTNRGEKHQIFEDQLRTILDVENLALFANGHLALEALIDAFQLTGEVITTPFTFASTTNALVRKGITPVFADISPIDFTLDPSKIEALITPLTTAIMPVHVYGAVADYESIQEIARRHDLKVIYDAAHAFGVKKNSLSTANLGDASMFSLHATKVFHSIEGGIAVVKDPKIVKRLYSEQNFGITGPEHIEFVGGNAKMNEFSAAMGICNLRRLEQDIKSREIAFSAYRSRLENIRGLYVPPSQKNVVSNYSYFPIQVSEDAFGTSREDVLNELAKNEITARRYFSPLTSEFPSFGGQFDTSATPVAKRVSEEILVLPLYAELNPEQVDRVCDIILSCRGGVK